jgi:2-dehydro-3-deoxyphosphogalactonate aldolase
MTTTVLWPALRRSLVAILRGVTPDAVEDIADALVEAGFEAIEVPLNSPDPFASIARLATRHGERALIGGGTILTPEAVDRVADAGGRLMVSPNFRRDVVERACARGMVTMPGVFTATEAFAALDAGASGLKFFPAGALGPEGIAALRAVLPKEAVIGAVGGVAPETMQAYVAAGVTAFGLGTGIYRPGDRPDTVRTRALAAAAAYDRAMKGE